MKIKICGLSRVSDVDAVNEAKPDFVGFVFAESRRRVTPAQASEMKSRLDGSIRAVGVFVNAEIADIERLCLDGVIDLVQLHGDEDARYIELVRERTGAEVIKAVRVRDSGQIKRAQKLPCDYLLLDTYREGAYGGTGEQFDHSIIPRLDKPFFLAGGITAENMGKAAEVRPFCLDISSGAETGGVKDPAKILRIVRMAREERWK